MATNYQRGRAFEYRTRDKLYEQGAEYVMRAAQSKGKVDLIALFPELGECIPHVWIVQCKRDGRLSVSERSALLDIAQDTGAQPYLAKTGKNGRGVVFQRLTKET
jgi:Holliday junction resolvase